MYTKFRNSLIMLIYANVRSPEGTRGVQSAIIFFFFFFLHYYFFFFFFMSLLGRQIYIFLTLIFFFYVPSGASNFSFLASRKLYHMKFEIFDVARCRMSATSLTFWSYLYLLFICTVKPICTLFFLICIDGSTGPLGRRVLKILKGPPWLYKTEMK